MTQVPEVQPPPTQPRAERRNRAVTIGVAAGVAVLAGAAVAYGGVVYPLLENRALELCGAAGLAAGGDSVGLNSESLFPPRFTCTITDAQGRAQTVVYDLGRLLD